MDLSAWSRAIRSPQFVQLDREISGRAIQTLCRISTCPNVHECWSSGQVALCVGGTGVAAARSEVDQPPPLDGDEPGRVAAQIGPLGLGFVAIGGVALSSLPDAGAWLLARSCLEVRRASPMTGVVLEVSDFAGKGQLSAEVIATKPQIFSHDLEVVPRLYAALRPGFDYQRSLDVLAQAKGAGLVTKSHLSLGQDESLDEAVAVMDDLRSVGCDLLTLGQHLTPKRWVKSEVFVELAKVAQQLGFTGVLAGTEVRSCYQMTQLWNQHTANQESLGGEGSAAGSFPDSSSEPKLF
ncbi:MAG: lipoyl synthase [Micrococcales bacterium]|nr:lipoyl synthase [Micrococcales bacterium]